MKLTATTAGYYVVRVNGVAVSRHLAEREAIESAISRVDAGVVDYFHDYVVRVEPDKPPPVVDTFINSLTGTVGVNKT